MNTHLVPPALALALAAAGASAATFTNTTDGFADDSTFDRPVTVTAGDLPPGAAFVDEVEISVFFAKSNTNSFVAEGDPIPMGTPSYNEIRLRLTSPAGTSVDLIDYGDFDDTNTMGFKGTITFDDDAADVVNVDQDNIRDGTFRPTGTLADFDGESALGTWALTVGDNAGGDGLSFYEFTLNVGTAAVPTPAAAGGGLALLALNGLRRRRA